MRFTVHNINSTHCSFVQKVWRFSYSYPLGKTPTDHYYKVVYPELSIKVVLHPNLLGSDWGETKEEDNRRKVSPQGQQVVSNTQ